MACSLGIVGHEVLGTSDPLMLIVRALPCRMEVPQPLAPRLSAPDSRPPAHGW